MNKFTNAIELNKNWTLMKISWTDKFIVQESFLWYLNYEKKEYYVEVEKCFKSDFWSIPKILQSIFNPTKYIIYLAHDKIYKFPFVKSSMWGWLYSSRMLSRKECDLILLEWLKVEKSKLIERYCIYIWVRIFWKMFFKD